MRPGTQCGRRVAAWAVADREAELGGEPRIPESADPAVAAVERERSRRLLEALDGLSEDHRQVVINRYLLELDETETAQALGWPKGTVKSRLKPALKKLGLVLEEGLTEGPEGGEEHG